MLGCDLCIFDHKHNASTCMLHQLNLLTFFLFSAIICFSVSLSMLIFSLSDLTWSQNRFGGGLHTDCSVGIWNATALEALISVNAFLVAVELLSAK